MHNLHNPCVPFVEPFYETVTPGTKIDVHGHLHHGHHKLFVVELLSGPHHVLHLSFRFEHHEHVLVMNSSAHGNWGCEERVHNPISHHDSHFQLSIHIHATHYDVHVNGRLAGSFRHRYPIEMVQALGVRGDVRVENVHFHGFAFRHQWGAGGFDWGHNGYIGYGTSAYVAPQFHEHHRHHHSWKHHN